MRIVLDTNIVVSALLWGGTPYRLIEMASAGTIELYSSPALVAELTRILERGHLLEKMTEQNTSAQAIISLYSQLAHIVSPTAVPRVVPGDPDDDHLIACAVLAGADIIVSGDRKVLALAQHRGIAILSVKIAIGRIDEAVE